MLKDFQYNNEGFSQGGMEAEGTQIKEALRGADFVQSICIYSGHGGGR